MMFRTGSVVDVGKQNCNISLSQKPIIWFLKLRFKFIRGFNATLGLSELIVNLEVGSHDPISIQLTLKIFVCVMEFIGVHTIQFLHSIIS